MVRASTVTKALLAVALLLLATCSPEQITDPGPTAPSVPVIVQAGHVDVTAIPSDLWIKEPGIRLDLGAGDPPATKGFHTPYVFRFPDGTLRMYYDAFDFTTGMGEIRSATSTDGLTWTKESGARLTNVFHPHVIQVGPGLYRMYVEKQGTPPTIESATSDDGLTWVMEAGARINGLDPVVLELPSGGFRMYYRPGSKVLQIWSANSSDGLMWNVEGKRVDNAREFAAIRLPDGTVIIYYGTGSSAFTAIQSARSLDGLNFILEGVRLLPGGPPNAPLDDGRILTTSILQFPGAVIRMYYQGSPGDNINESARVFSAVVTLEPEARIDAMILELENLVTEDALDPDKVEDVIAKLQTALDELNKTPPGNQAALGAIEGAVGDLQAAVDARLLDPGLGTPLMDQLSGTARQLAVNAMDQAIACDPGNSDIAAAQQALDEGDALRASGFKDAVNKYKDALAKAEGVLSSC